MVYMYRSEVTSCSRVQSDSPEQRAVAIEAAAQAIQDMQQWRQKRKFLSPQQLSTWEPLVRIGTTLNPHQLWVPVSKSLKTPAWTGDNQVSPKSGMGVFHVSAQWSRRMGTTGSDRCTNIFVQ